MGATLCMNVAESSTNSTISYQELAHNPIIYFSNIAHGRSSKMWGRELRNTNCYLMFIKGKLQLSIWVNHSQPIFFTCFPSPKSLTNLGIGAIFASPIACTMYSLKKKTSNLPYAQTRRHFPQASPS